MFIKILLSLSVILFGIADVSTKAIVLQSFPLDLNFDAILSTCICDVTLTTIPKNQPQSIDIHGEPDTLFYLRLGFEQVQKNVRLFNFFAVGLNSSKIHININARNVLRWYVHVGDGDITAYSRLGLINDNRRFTLDHYGSGNVKMKLNLEYFEANLYGSGVYLFEGFVKNEAIYHATRNAFLDASKLATKKLNATAEDYSEAIVEAKIYSQLKGTGSARVIYKENPNVSIEKSYRNDDSCLLKI